MSFGAGAAPYVDADRVPTVPVVLPPLGAQFIRAPVYVVQYDAAGRTLLLGADFADPPLHPLTRVELNSVASPEVISLGGGDLVFGGAAAFPFGRGHVAALPDGRFATVGDPDGRLYADAALGVVLGEGAAVPRLDEGPGPSSRDD